jgi:hypothetical protein
MADPSIFLGYLGVGIVWGVTNAFMELATTKEK